MQGDDPATEGAADGLDEQALVRRARQRKRRRRIMATATATLLAGSLAAAGAVVAPGRDGDSDVRVQPPATQSTAAPGTTADDPGSVLPEGPPTPPEPGTSPCAADGDIDATGLETINRYLDAALGVGSPPAMSSAAARQLEAQRSTGRLERFTQGGGFRVLTDETVELCVTTYERDADGRLVGSDGAVAAIRRGSGWEAVRWVRGNARVRQETETVTVPFYRSGSTCAERDFVYAELEVPSRRADSVNAAVGAALLEVLSGPTGRFDARTAIPQTTRLYSNVIEQGTNYVALLSENIDVRTCDGRAARDQVGEAAQLAAQRHGFGDDEVIIAVFDCARQANGFDNC